MLNRRFLRIKVFQSLYGFAQEEKPLAHLYKRAMLNNLEKTYELYLFTLSFPLELKFFVEQELEVQKSKYFPLDNLIKPLEALRNNKVIELMEQNVQFQEAIKKVKPRWIDSLDFSKKIFNEIKPLAFFQEYIAKGSPTFNEDKAFLTTLFEQLFSDSEQYESYMEEAFVNWEDDQVLVLTSLQKMFNQLKEAKPEFLIDAHKDEDEDLKFMKDLFDFTIEHQAMFNELINSKTQNWDQDRIALVDILLMRMALCEIMFFPFVPVKVSINEYLELAKLYSTPNSHGFINGVLDKIQMQLKKDNKINKMGRGLME
ncbi:MAG: transcription antitermination factor NusB [Bacteroidia bacterium]